MEVRVAASELLVRAVNELRECSGYRFQISSFPVTGTGLFVVHTEDHPFRAEYTIARGALGFRVPLNFPDAGPEDAFFISPIDVKLVQPDRVRNSVDLNRASRVDNFVIGSSLGNVPVLLFSWHLWNTVKWNTVKWDRRVHTLVDHYTHCTRRFDQPENG
jgi:hypothetical protein